MKARLIILSVLALCLGISAKAQDDRIITLDRLPQNAKEFLAKHFPDKTPMVLKEDWDDFEVMYTNGEKVEFLKNGEWKKVDCRTAAVPTSSSPSRSRPRSRPTIPAPSSPRSRKTAAVGKSN